MNGARWWWRLAWREWRAGELYWLAAAVCLATAACTAVLLLSGRIERALFDSPARWLGADLVVVSDQPLPPAWPARAGALGLQRAEVQQLVSVVRSGERWQLASIRGLGAGYPLRGPGAGKNESRPQAGQAWADAQLSARLQLGHGATLQLGATRLNYAPGWRAASDSLLDRFDFLPRLEVPLEALATSQLVQPASRVRYRLLLAGPPAQIQTFKAWAAAHPQRGVSLETGTPRAELATLLERARGVLGAASLLTVLLSGVALWLAWQRFVLRHWSLFGLLRALGARRGELFGCLAVLLGVVVLPALGAGAWLGWRIEHYWQGELSGWLGDALPQLAWWGYAQGAALVLLCVLALLLPSVPTLWRHSSRALLAQRWNGVAGAWSSWLMLLPVLALLGTQLAGGWQAGALAVMALAGLAALLLGSGLGLRALARRRAWRGLLPGWRYGVHNALVRRDALSVVQWLGLSLALAALLLLAGLRGEWLNSWQRALPSGAHNTFVLNIQPEQRAAFSQLLQHYRVPAEPLWPMARARLLAINGREVLPERYADARARRLAEREFNLSWQSALAAPSRGQGWAASSKQPQFSVEQGLADTLGIKLGDTLQFDVAGESWQASVTSLRRVEWQSLRANFFVVGPAGWLDELPASYLASLRLGPEHAPLVRALLRDMPELTVIEVGDILAELQRQIDSIGRVVGTLFWLALGAGLLVVVLGVSSVAEQRRGELALLRALGASRAQLWGLLGGEWLALGALAGLLGGGAAQLLLALLAGQLFAHPWWGPWWLVPLALAGGAALCLAVALPLLWTLARVSPLQVLRGGR